MEPTADFILKFNNLFDILNSRNRLAKYFYKKPLSPSTAKEMFNFLDEMYSYILNIKLGDCHILKSSRKTGFLGFLICINSLKSIYQYYVCNKKILKYVLTHKLSQDHLELFFGTIRSKGGFNNNPSARQFEAAYKRLLVHSQIRAPDSGNAINLDHVTILVSTTPQNLTSDDGLDLQQNQEFIMFQNKLKEDMLKFDFFSSSSWNLTDYSENVVSYIAGFVIKSLKKCVTCLNCRVILEGEETYSLLQKRKQFGKLVNASKTVVSICKAAEKYFKFFMKIHGLLNKNTDNLLNHLVLSTFRTLNSDILDEFKDHLYDGTPPESHGFKLPQQI